MLTDVIADTFTRNSERPPIVEDLYRQAANLLDNSPQLAVQLIRRVCEVSTIQPSLQQDYVDNLILQLKPDQRIEAFIRDCARTLADPPQLYLADAVTLLPSANDLAASAPNEPPQLHKACSDDVQGATDDIALSIAGAMLYQSTLDNSTRSAYVASFTNHIAALNGAFEVMGRVMQAVNHMNHWRPDRSIEATDVARLKLRADSILRDQPRIQPGPGREINSHTLAETHVNRMISRRCRNVMKSDDTTLTDTQALAFWEETLQNLPRQRRFWQ